MQLRLCWSLRAIFNLSCKRGRMQSWAAFSLQKTGRSFSFQQHCWLSEARDRRNLLSPETVLSTHRSEMQGPAEEDRDIFAPWASCTFFVTSGDGSLKSAVCSARNYDKKQKEPENASQRLSYFFFPKIPWGDEIKERRLNLCLWAGNRLSLQLITHHSSPFFPLMASSLTSFLVSSNCHVSTTAPFAINGTVKRSHFHILMHWTSIIISHSKSTERKKKGLSHLSALISAEALLAHTQKRKIKKHSRGIFRKKNQPIK